MLFLMVNEKTLFQAAQKDLRDEARDESRSGGVRVQYVGATRSSGTKYMRLFQQPA
jgi:hypothetical protein